MAHSAAGGLGFGAGTFAAVISATYRFIDSLIALQALLSVVGLLTLYSKAECVIDGEYLLDGLLDYMRFLLCMCRYL